MADQRDVALAQLADQPQQLLYNYTRDFPYLWEEIVLPIDYDVDRDRVEQILLTAAHGRAVVDDPDARRALAYMRSRYALSDASLEPAVFWRITDNWLEMSLRFLVGSRGVREVKDAISRQILDELDAAGIAPASATYNIVGLPPLRLDRPEGDARLAEQPIGLAQLADHLLRRVPASLHRDRSFLAHDRGRVELSQGSDRTQGVRPLCEST